MLRGVRSERLLWICSDRSFEMTPAPQILGRKVVRPQGKRLINFFIMQPEIIDLCTDSQNAASPSKKRRRIQPTQLVSVDMASVQRRRSALQKRHQKETRELKERQAQETDQLEYDIEAEVESFKNASNKIGGLACIECGEVPASFFACASCAGRVCKKHETDETKCSSCSEAYCSPCSRELADSCRECAEMGILHCCEPITVMPCGSITRGDCYSYHVKSCHCEENDEW